MIFLAESCEISLCRRQRNRTEYNYTYHLFCLTSRCHVLIMYKQASLQFVGLVVKGWQQQLNGHFSRQRLKICRLFDLLKFRKLNCVTFCQCRWSLKKNKYAQMDSRTLLTIILRCNCVCFEMVIFQQSVDFTLLEA